MSIRNHKSGWAFVGFVGIAAVIAVSVLMNNTPESSPAPQANTNTTIAPATSSTNTNTSTSSAQPAGEESLTEQDQKILELFGFWIPGLETDPPNYTQKVSGTSTTYDFDDGNAISVMPADEARTVRNSLSSIQEKQIEVDGHVARRISGISPKDGARLHYLLIENGDQSLLLRGSSDFLTAAEKELKIQTRP